MLWGFYKLLQAKHTVRIQLRAFKFDSAMLWRILRITGPAILQRGFPNLAMVILLRLIAAYGAETLAAWVVITRLSSFAFLIGMGISSIAGAMVGQNLGAKQPQRAKIAVNTITYLVLGITILILTILGVFAPGIMRIFSSSPETVAVGITIIRLLLVGFAGQTVSWVFDSALVGAGDTVSPMVIYALTWGIQLPLAYILSIPLGYGTRGIWTALNIGWCTQAILLWLRFKQGKWQYNEI
jgi:Na+-driven multidrug efflux pump